MLCVTQKLSLFQDMVKFASYVEFDAQFDLKVLGPLGGKLLWVYCPVVVLGLVR